MEAVILDCLRTPVGKAPKGALRNTRPDDLAAIVIRRLIKKHPAIAPEEIDDVILGCAMPEAESGMNVARIAALRAGLPDSVPGITINRFCSSGLQAIAMAADRIRSGGAQIIIAGGAESLSMIPMAGNKFAPNPWMVDHLPQIYMGMGLTAEQVQKKYGITREDADQFAYRSHQHALHAQAAGNSSQTSDGAAAAIVMSDKKAEALGLKPMARFVSFAVAGVPPEIMGIGPVVAIPKALALAGLKKEDIGVIELNEAFAVQALAVIRKAGLDLDRVNPNGGAIALGHPLGCTGAKLTATILREMHRKDTQYGMVTMCVGGGQGAAGIFENLIRNNSDGILDNLSHEA
jgi:acetyl-CoA acyltransferase